MHEIVEFEILRVQKCSQTIKIPNFKVILIKIFLVLIFGYSDSRVSISHLGNYFG